MKTYTSEYQYIKTMLENASTEDYKKKIYCLAFVDETIFYREK